MSNDSESHIHYLQTPNYSPRSAVLQRETPQSTLPTLKAKLEDRRFNEKLKRILRKKRIRENRYTKIVNKCSKEETPNSLMYFGFHKSFFHIVIYIIVSKFYHCTSHC